MAGDSRPPHVHDDRLPPDDRSEETPQDGERRGRGERKGGFRDMARRILSDRDGAQKDPQIREAFISLLETGNQARTELMRFMAREMRGYLTELRVGEGLHHLLTNYSLEVHASFHLKPLADAMKAENSRAERKDEDPSRPVEPTPE